MRRQAHELIDRLPDRQVAGLVRFLECFAHVAVDAEPDVSVEQLVSDLGFSMEQALRVRD